MAAEYGILAIAGEYGIKETKEVIDLVVGVVALETAKAVKKDGFQYKDLTEFLKSPELEAKVTAAIEGIEQVPHEMGDLGIVDGVALARYVYGKVDEVMDVLRQK